MAFLAKKAIKTTINGLFWEFANLYDFGAKLHKLLGL
jgi:hypothetical protein